MYNEPYQFTSPPSYVPHDTVKKNKLSAHQSAVKNMTETERWAYADEKLK
jgi:hypothetical protein